MHLGLKLILFSIYSLYTLWSIHCKLLVFLPNVLPQIEMCKAHLNVHHFHLPVLCYFHSRVRCSLYHSLPLKSVVASADYTNLCSLWAGCVLKHAAEYPMHSEKRASSLMHCSTVPLVVKSPQVTFKLSLSRGTILQLKNAAALKLEVHGFV